MIDLELRTRRRRRMPLTAAGRAALRRAKQQLARLGDPPAHPPRLCRRIPRAHCASGRGKCVSDHRACADCCLPSPRPVNKVACGRTGAEMEERRGRGRAGLDKLTWLRRAIGLIVLKCRAGDRMPSARRGRLAGHRRRQHDQQPAGSHTRDQAEHLGPARRPPNSAI